MEETAVLMMRIINEYYDPGNYGVIKLSWGFPKFDGVLPWGLNPISPNFHGVLPWGQRMGAARGG